MRKFLQLYIAAHPVGKDSPTNAEGHSFNLILNISFTSSGSENGSKILIGVQIRVWTNMCFLKASTNVNIFKLKLPVANIMCQCSMSGACGLAVIVFHPLWVFFVILYQCHCEFLVN